MVFDLAILDHIFCHWKKGRKRKNDNELDLIQIHLKLHQPIIAFYLAGGLTLSKFKFSYCIIENSGIWFMRVLITALFLQNAWLESTWSSDFFSITCVSDVWSHDILIVNDR